MLDVLDVLGVVREEGGGGGAPDPVESADAEWNAAEQPCRRALPPSSHTLRRVRPEWSGVGVARAEPFMDPEGVDQAGERADYTWASLRARRPAGRRASELDRYANHVEFMRGAHREMHRLRALPEDEAREYGRLRAAGLGPDPPPAGTHLHRLLRGRK